jgi:ATP-dependent DNA helicase DinG
MPLSPAALADWHEHFPFPDWREAQALALDFAVKKFLQYDDIFIEAPTGIGKSAIAVALARWLASLDKKTYIATTTVALENQYMGDFYKLGLRQLHAKRHYPCDEWTACDLGSTTIRTINGTYKRCQSEACTYQIAKAAFMVSPLSIANAAFLLTCARHVQGWEPRPLAVFDEAHTLAETVAGNYSIPILARDVAQMPSEGAELEWLRDWYSHELEVQICELEEEFQHAADNDLYDPALGHLFKRLEAAERKLQNLSKLLADDPNEWVFDLQPDRLNILPLWGAKLASELLPRIGRKRIYLSATLPGAELQMRYLGIDPAKAAFLSLDSPFPLKNRLIHVCPLVHWNWQNPEPAISSLCQALDRILALHPDDRGLVHVSSYRQAREVVERSRNPRLITHETSQDKEARITEMFETPGAVLVSPSSHEGLDLYGDRSRFQVIAKLPFASIGDKRVKRRMERDKQWYPLHTAQKLIQSCGRSIRSEVDHATTYLIDAGFVNFYRQAHQLFPKYFLDSLRTGEVPL